MKLSLRSTGLVALASAIGFASAIAATTPASATPEVNVNWDCKAHPPLGDDAYLTLGTTIDTDAPASIARGDIFEIVMAPKPQAVPDKAAGHDLNKLKRLTMRLPVPAGTTLRGVWLTGGSNLNSTATVTNANGVVSVYVPGPLNPGTTIQLPAVHLSVSASGEVGNTITTNVSGTGYNDPGLEFTADVHISPGIDPDVPAKCFPNPSPALSTTAIRSAGTAPASDLTPALATNGKRTVEVLTGADGHLYYDWWDLGGGANGWREIPGTIRSDASPAASLVAYGDYMFVVVKGTDGGIWINQGTPGGSFVGWRFAGINSKVGPGVASNGNRTVALVTGTNGRIYYSWWDLGGGATPFQELPGNGGSDAAPAGSLVGGNYLFAYVHGGGNNIYLNQGTLGGSFVGWRSTGIQSNVAPQGSASGDRSVITVTRSDGHLFYDWWDLGGGAHGWHEFPGGFTSSNPVAVGLVDSGNYAFAVTSKWGILWLNQGSPVTGTWVGWRG